MMRRAQKNYRMSVRCDQTVWRFATVMHTARARMTRAMRFLLSIATVVGSTRDGDVVGVEKDFEA